MTGECENYKYTIILRHRENTHYIENLTEEQKNEHLKLFQNKLWENFKYEVIKIPIYKKINKNG